MSKQAVELTEAEWFIIKAVWDNEPCTAPQIQEELFKQTQWTYSTARTLMDRMVGKGLLKAHKEGKMTIYRSAVTPDQAQKGELLYTLKHVFNGALEPMVQCLLNTSNVSREELAKLKQIIAAHEAELKMKGKKS